MTSSPNPPKKVTPLNCLTGATISATLAVALYTLTTSIVHNFATHPLISEKVIVLRLSSLVRTLVIGLASLGTFVCAFVALGLILLAIQITFQKEKTE